MVANWGSMFLVLWQLGGRAGFAMFEVRCSMFDVPGGAAAAVHPAVGQIKNQKSHIRYQKLAFGIWAICFRPTPNIVESAMFNVRWFWTLDVLGNALLEPGLSRKAENGRLEPIRRLIPTSDFALPTSPLVRPKSKMVRWFGVPQGCCSVAPKPGAI